jgi:hypothetical protein
MTLEEELALGLLKAKLRARGRLAEGLSRSAHNVLEHKDSWETCSNESCSGIRELLVMTSEEYDIRAYVRAN